MSHPVAVALAAAALAVAALAVGVTAAPAAGGAVAPTPGADTATVTVLLDFDGHTTARTRWNRTFTDRAPIVTSAFDVDGDPGRSVGEQWWVDTVREAVAEDFAPFDLDVTTVDPGAEALRYHGPGDRAYGVRVVGPERDWYPERSHRGVAHLGSLGRTRTPAGVDDPAFVFATGWVLGSPVRLADLVTHEVGHTFGLRHDGVAPAAPGSDDSYERGRGLWGPIMGAPYLVPLSQWSRGEYPRANNREDDLAIIATRAGLVPDDAAGRDGAHTPLAAGTSRLGLIGTPHDTDAFLVRLDLAGTLTVAVDGVGEPGPDGFGDYSSLGRYRIRAQLSSS